nr:hypothetical protein [Staphylococcus aureus]
MLLLRKPYNGEKRIEWKEVLAGQKAFDTTGECYLKKHLIQLRIFNAVKGPLTTQLVVVLDH